MSLLHIRRRAPAALTAAAIAVLVIGCQSKSGPASGFSSPMSGRTSAAEDSKKISDGLKLLMDSIDKPKAALHFSYQATENVNPKFPMTNGELPRVGSVNVEADISPDEVSVTENRDGKKSDAKGSKSDEGSYRLAKLGVLGCMLEVTFPFAYAGPTATAAGSNSVGNVAADKYDMDTTTANATTQAAMAAVTGMLNGKVKVNSVKGSAWLEKSSGRLVKFDLNAELSTQNGHTWQEHYQVIVAPKSM